MNTQYQYLFGPVLSRRFGRSLGIDLLGERRCSFDCIFCEAGRTDILNVERREFVPVADVIKELQRWIKEAGRADVITLAGRGEPTLHSRLGDIVDAIHEISMIPIVLLTNSSLLSLPDVRRDACKVDIAKCSLSAWDDASLHKLNRPVPGLSFAQLLEGIQLFRRSFKGEFRLEIMVVEGVNDSAEAQENISVLANDLKADRIELNTVTRPPAYEDAESVSLERLAPFAALYKPKAQILASSPAHVPSGLNAVEAELLSLLSRRAFSLKELISLSGATPQKVETVLANLESRGTIRRMLFQGMDFYSA